MPVEDEDRCVACRFGRVCEDADLDTNILKDAFLGSTYLKGAVIYNPVISLEGTHFWAAVSFHLAIFLDTHIWAAI